ncbi:S-receptor-like serine/threonine-protein kinase protein, partial [Dioscorea alata]
MSWEQSLSGDQILVSKEGHFELGFFSPGDSKNYYIGIWYKKVSPQTIIWVANREIPISNTTSSELKIAENGNLALVSNRKKLVWSSNSTAYHGNSTVAELLDTGNLVLRNNLNSSAVVWQSFDHPIDTWVPGGGVGMNKITGEYQSLTSWKNFEDPSPGPFIYTIVPSGLNQFLLQWNGSETYRSTGVWNGHAYSGLPGMDTSPNYVNNFTDNSERKQCTLTFNMKDAYTRSVLDPSGQITQWLWTNDSQEWELIWSEPVDPCDVYSVCGTFGICDHSTKIFCSCPPGFEPVSLTEWNFNDWSSGCKRKTRLPCSENDNSTNREKEGFLPVSFTRLPAGSQPLEVRSMQECKAACLRSCSCTAYSYDRQCLIWNGDVRNLQKNGNAGSLYIRLAASDIPCTGKKKSSRLIIIGLCSGSAAASCIIMAVFLWIFLRKRQNRGMVSIEGILVQFKYSDPRRMTKNFSEMLGKGGFGSVFKGALPDLTPTAVKQLRCVMQQEKDFRSEVLTLGRIQHINLIRLIGFCCEGTKRLLVYDNMPKGSLDRHLFNRNEVVLDWKTRYKIIVGVAKGLEYLHEKCRDCIIHCDVKPENILLDSEFCPKVSDFGMAKLIHRDFSKVLTSMKGTIGYLAPEWILGQPITPKTDVYSYGMMLFEVISGRRNSHQSQSTNNRYFPVWVANKLMEGDILSLLNENLTQDTNMEELTRVCKVACWCIQENEAHRPSMGMVVLMLEGVMEVKLAPVPPFLALLTEGQGSHTLS